MCNSCFSYVQFPGILPSDTSVQVNGGQYPANDTIQDLVTNNPQFWWDFGLSGTYTLCSYIILGNNVDIDITVMRGGNPVTVRGVGFVKGRPTDR